MTLEKQPLRPSHASRAEHSALRRSGSHRLPRVASGISVGVAEPAAPSSRLPLALLATLALASLWTLLLLIPV